MPTKVREARAKRLVKQAVRKIEPERIPEILAEAWPPDDDDEGNPLDETKPQAQVKEVKTGKPQPGSTTREGNKIPWTWKDLVARYKMVELEADETVIFTWNGIQFQFYAGAIHTVPEPVKTAWNLRKQNLRHTIKKFDNNPGFETEIALGAGSLEPE